MEDSITSLFPMILLLIIMILVVYKSIRNKNHGALFNPIIFVCIYYTYYVIIPYFFQKVIYIGI